MSELVETRTYAVTPGEPVNQPDGGVSVAGDDGTFTASGTGAWLDALERANPGLVARCFSWRSPTTSGERSRA